MISKNYVGTIPTGINSQTLFNRLYSRCKLWVNAGAGLSTRRGANFIQAGSIGASPKLTSSSVSTLGTITNKMTIFAWVDLTAALDANGVNIMSQWSNGGWQMSIYGDQLAFVVGSSNSNFRITQAYPTTSYTRGVSLVMIVYDGEGTTNVDNTPTSADKVKVCINGVQQSCISYAGGTFPDTPNTLPPTPQSQPFYLGHSPLAYKTFNGVMGPCGIIKAAIDSSDVALMYNGGVPLTYAQANTSLASAANILHYWNMDESTGTRVDAKSGMNVTEVNGPIPSSTVAISQLDQSPARRTFSAQFGNAPAVSNGINSKPTLRNHYRQYMRNSLTSPLSTETTGTYFCVYRIQTLLASEGWTFALNNTGANEYAMPGCYYNITGTYRPGVRLRSTANGFNGGIKANDMTVAINTDYIICWHRDANGWKCWQNGVESEDIEVDSGLEDKWLSSISGANLACIGSFADGDFTLQEIAALRLFEPALSLDEVGAMMASLNAEHGVY